MTHSCQVRGYTRTLPDRSVAQQAMLLSLSAQGRIEPRTMDQVIEAALEMDLKAFGEEQ